MRISPTQPKYLGIQVTGKIEDGKVVLYGDKTGVFNTLSPAGVHVTDRSTNGWDFWDIKLPDSDQWVLATYWRDKIIKL